MTRCASQNCLRSNIAHTGGSNVTASMPIILIPWSSSQWVASPVIHMISEVSVGVLDLPRACVDQDNIQRLQRVGDFREPLLHFVHPDSRAFGQMPEVEADAVAVAVL